MGGGSSKTSCTHPYRPGKEFKGIINYLTIISNGNPALKGQLEITASSTSVRSVSQIEDVLVERNDGEWSSNNEPESWIKFDFKEHKVELRNYTLQTFAGKANNTHLKSWRVEGSDNNFDWVELENVQNNNFLNSPNAVYNRAVLPKGLFRYIRIMMTDKNFFGTNTFTLKRVEFFGNYI